MRGESGKCCSRCDSALSALKNLPAERFFGFNNSLLALAEVPPPQPSIARLATLRAYQLTRIENCRGVPVVEATNTATTTTTASTSTPTSRDTTYAKREAATAEALAQARAVVEAQQKQEHEQSQNGQRQDNGAAGDGGNKEEGQTDQTAENNATTISAGAKRQRGAESVSPGAAGQAPITTGAETGAAAPEDVSRDDDSEVPPSKKARQD